MRIAIAKCETLQPQPNDEFGSFFSLETSVSGKNTHFSLHVSTSTQIRGTQALP